LARWVRTANWSQNRSNRSKMTPKITDCKIWRACVKGENFALFGFVACLGF
jgi:hypothetical protein